MRTLEIINPKRLLKEMETRIDMDIASAKEIHGIVSRQQAAWNRGDSRDFSMDCDNEISFTNILGKVYFSREDFDELHAQIFKTIFKGSTIKLLLRRIHFPSKTIAVVDLSAEVTGYQALPSGVKAPTDGVLRTSLMQVFIRTESGWRMVAYHNVDIKN
jgi:uncharacterized protein (TIGR02246 family)